MATHSSILAWEIPSTEEPVRLQSTGVSKSRTRLKQLNNDNTNPSLTCAYWVPGSGVQTAPILPGPEHIACTELGV